VTGNQTIKEDEEQCILSHGTGRGKIVFNTAISLITGRSSHFFMTTLHDNDTTHDDDKLSRQRTKIRVHHDHSKAWRFSRRKLRSTRRHLEELSCREIEKLLSLEGFWRHYT
jgi:hypothetical protein